MILKRTTDAIIEPVTLAEAKAALRVDYANEDDLINSLIKSARQFCEQEISLSFLTQTWQLKLDCWPCGIIELPYGPVQSISSITYVDTEGDTQTLDSSVYQLDGSSIVARLYTAYGESWPSVRDQLAPIEINYVAGNLTAEDVQDDIKTAIKLLVGHWLQNRSDTTTFTLNNIPYGVNRLIKHYKAFTL